MSQQSDDGWVQDGNVWSCDLYGIDGRISLAVSDAATPPGTKGGLHVNTSVVWARIETRGDMYPYNGWFRLHQRSMLKAKAEIIGGMLTDSVLHAYWEAAYWDAARAGFSFRTQLDIC